MSNILFSKIKEALYDRVSKWYITISAPVIITTLWVKGMFDILLSKVKFFFKNPMVIFVYGIASKWYITIFVTAIVVVFWIFKGLDGAGFIKAAEEVVFRALKDTKSVARYCVPKIGNLGNFWECVQSPPEYEETEDEIKLKKGLNTLLKFDSEPGNEEDPYSGS